MTTLQNALPPDIDFNEFVISNWSAGWQNLQEPMKDKVFHESSLSDDNNELLNRASTSAVPPFNPAGELVFYNDGENKVT